VRKEFVFVLIMDPPQLLFLGSSKIKAVYTILKTLQYIDRLHNTVCPQAPTPPLPQMLRNEGTI
jgi:hypothetical protein